MDDFKELKAYGKINLGLDVLGERKDNYHELRMIMQTVSVCDDISVKVLPEDEIRIETRLLFDERSKLEYGGIEGKDNIAYKAAKLMKDLFNIEKGFHIRIDKRIPIAAGMGGGSADAAAVIKALNSLLDLRLKEDELTDLGLKLGADVPYCIVGGTVLAEGIGEKLTKLKALPETGILLVKPELNVSTKEVYEGLKSEDLKAEERPDIDNIVKAIEEQDIRAVCKGLKNVMETYTVKKYPVIANIKEAMMKENARASLMSGSGPTVFGIFDKEEELMACYEKFRNGVYRNLATQIYVSTTVNY